VLKFMGDGLLGIFPIDEREASPSALCDAALAAADEAFAANRAANAAKIARGEAEIRFGLALHVGDVAYGNIGGAGRLDFTCIGPAVNVAARLESLTGVLGRPVVASAEFAALTTRPLVDVGAFELKGVAGEQRVFGAPPGDPIASW
jgi:adenylate cyclase